jgi:quercetin dioxygenase-like cupin family protein
MQRYSFDRSTSQHIDQYNCINAFVTHLTRGEERFFVVVITVEANGLIGRHLTVDDQLFFVISGQGMVSGEDGIFFPIQAGQMAHWQSGESHETRSEYGLTAMVIEGRGLSPSPHLIPID